MTQTILVVEDERKLSQSLCEFLDYENFVSHPIYHGDEVVDWVKLNNPSVILLDLMLPGKDGIDICKEIREFSSVPIIMVTARTDEVHRLLGLDIGADDYVCKPYSLREVVARIKAVLRRNMPLQQDNSVGIQINSNTFRVSYEGNEVELTTVEFKLLEAMEKSAGQIFTRDHLIQKIYQDGRVVSDRTVDSHVKKLRQKLAVIAPDFQCIHSVYGAGYKYEV